jgi:hypothetical protein
MVNIIVLIASAVTAAPIKFDLQKQMPNYQPFAGELNPETKLEQIHAHFQKLLE